MLSNLIQSGRTDLCRHLLNRLFELNEYESEQEEKRRREEETKGSTAVNVNCRSRRDRTRSRSRQIRTLLRNEQGVAVIDLRRPVGGQRFDFGLRETFFQFVVILIGNRPSNES